MPQLVPDTRTAQIAFFKGHLAAWRRAAADLGFTQEEIDAFGDALVGPAADAEFRARVARLAAEAATSEADRLAAKMTTTGRALIARIHAQAKAAGPIGSTGAARVWELAQLPAPRTPSKRRPPPAPSNLRSELNTTGELVVRWTVPRQRRTTARGTSDTQTYYEVARAPVLLTDPNSPPGTTGETIQGWETVSTPHRRLTDAPPRGACAVHYRVRGVNSTGPGPWSPIAVFRLTPAAETVPGQAVPGETLSAPAARPRPATPSGPGSDHTQAGRAAA